MDQPSFIKKAFLSVGFCMVSAVIACSGYLLAKQDRTVPLAGIKHFIYLPLVRQGTDYTCGVASTQSVLAYFGENYSEAELAEKLHPDTQVGTPPANIIKYLDSDNFEYAARDNMSLSMLEVEVDAGRPTMVLLQAWAENPEQADWQNMWDAGHWVVVAGYDDANIYLMDPVTLGQYAYVPRDQFMARWHDVDGAGTKLIQYGLTVWKKGTKPAFNFHDVVPMD